MSCEHGHDPAVCIRCAQHVCDEDGTYELAMPFVTVARSAFCVEFLPGRMRFIKGGELDTKPNDRPPFGCCLLIWTGGA